jgi:hypothetical protein
MTSLKFSEAEDARAPKMEQSKFARLHYSKTEENPLRNHRENIINRNDFIGADRSIPGSWHREDEVSVRM